MLANVTITECPLCGSSRCRTIDTRIDKRGWRRRRRGCACGHKWSTLEMPEDEIRNLILFHDRLNEMRHTLEELLKPRKGRGGKFTAQQMGIADASFDTDK